MENSFKIKFIECSSNSLKEIGFDSSYIHKGLEKHKFLSIKIFNLNCAQANIIKQTALSVGADSAVHRDVITGGVELSDCILSGSLAQLIKICEKLKHQPFKLQVLANQIISLIDVKPTILKLRDSVFDFSKRTYLMGILNLTPDSFSDGGLYNTFDAAIQQYESLLDAGADIIDIGGESTRPYSSPVSVDEEINRVIPVIERIRTFDKNTVISIDTRNSHTAKLALQAGADIVNDVSALDYDKNMLSVLIEYNCPIIINHSKGTPDVMQDDTYYMDVVSEVYDYLFNKIKFLTQNGIDGSKIIVDPGIGFGKNRNQNLDIIKRLVEFKTLKCPILVGHSRKSFIKETIGTVDNHQLDFATSIVSTKLVENGANILRVHNVNQHKTLLDVLNSLG